MTKYIDRYYLNGEMYAIKFAGGGGGRQPGANTIAYYPLTSSTQGNDMKGSGVAYNLTTLHTAPTYGTYQGVDCASFSGSNEIHNDSINTVWGAKSTFTVSLWMYSNKSSDNIPLSNDYLDTSGSPRQYYNTHIRAHPNRSGVYRTENVNTVCAFGISYNNQQWTHLVYTFNNGTITTYTNGVYSNTVTGTPFISPNGRFKIGAGYDEGNGWYSWFKGGLSNIIIEDKIWTAQEISDYYDQTKALYGIS